MGAVHVLAMDPAAGSLELPSELAGRAARWSDGSDATLEGGAVRIPDALRAQPVAALRVTTD
ncbi:hypothetical protein [Microbacterium sp. gxy059]|uniref:hypothetical protein n=1 Tax=Microbacterium sp. gxy059 TaxID=2957199 RepID=UPI003D984D4B